MKKVAILGFGPSALYAIAACNAVGIEPLVITDRPVTSPVGAFYLHWVPEFYAKLMSQYRIEYTYHGCEKVYLEKQWGKDAIDVNSSWGKYANEVGYNPSEFTELIAHKSKFVYRTGVKVMCSDLYDLSKQYDKVFCTIPFHFIPFDRVPVAIISTNFISPINSIDYYGEDKTLEVRRSILFGKICAELAIGIARNENTDEQKKTYMSREVIYLNDISPLSVFGPFDSTEDGVVFIGRNARYDRNELAHNAYERVLNELRGII